MVLYLPMLNKGSSYRSKGSSTSSPSNVSTTSFPSPASHSAANLASSTLAEALRGNPFGLTPRPSPKSTETLANEVEEQLRELQELNDSLVILAQLFPDIKVEVFRELLVRFDGTSRLEVCVAQLLRHQKEWVKGRWNVPSSSSSTTGSNTESASTTTTPPPPPQAVANNGTGNNPNGGQRGGVPTDELFRSDEYKDAVKAVVTLEFRSLNRSTIDAVLAESNFSYIRARPILLQLSQKTWRATLGNILSFKKRRKTTETSDPPLLIWQRHPDGELVPALKNTGCVELDHELYDAFLLPLVTQKREIQEEADLKLAEELNETEAKAADALYECDCCLSDVTFEQISTCSVSLHTICFSCIQRTLHEALFGQGWDKSIDAVRSTLRCIAPISDGICEGRLGAAIVKRAILAEQAGDLTYQKFEDRLASDALIKSQVKLIHCPFCSYAEIDPVFEASGKGITWRLRRASLLPTLFMAVFLLDLIPLLIIPFSIALFLYPSELTAILTASLQNLCLKTRNQRFTCANPSCQRDSCITCHKPWLDPHRCHEPLLLSLRTTVEAARTAAVKRTCPRCGLAFVKASGCNKLTCVCGYSMCYLCRKALGSPTNNNNPFRRPRRPQLNADGDIVEHLQFMDGAAEQDEDEPSGYKHFCEHFRINPGSACTECNKCDLYQAEDEESVAQRAGDKAEREWRIRQGLTGNSPSEPSNSNNNVNKVQLQLPRSQGRRPNLPRSRTLRPWQWDWQYENGKSKLTWKFWTEDIWLDGRWKMEAQALIDRLVETLIIVEAS